VLRHQTHHRLYSPSQHHNTLLTSLLLLLPPPLLLLLPPPLLLLLPPPLLLLLLLGLPPRSLQAALWSAASLEPRAPSETPKQ
jgi:hypothetical protein